MSAAELERLRARVAELTKALETCRQEAGCVLTRLGPSLEGCSIDDVTAERAWCDADTIFCAANAALQSKERGP